MENKKQTIIWETPEFKHYPKNTGWYITLFSVSILVIGFFIIFQKDYFAAVTCALLTGFIVYFGRQRPTLVLVELTHENLRFGNILYPYKQLKSFWVVTTPHHQTLNFIATTLVNNTIIIELEGQDPQEIRNFLLTYLEEHHETEPTFTQRISHKLNF